MPFGKNLPKALNDDLEEIYSECMQKKEKTDDNKTICSKIAWDVAKKKGWEKDDNEEWTKK